MGTGDNVEPEPDVSEDPGYEAEVVIPPEAYVELPDPEPEPEPDDPDVG